MGNVESSRSGDAAVGRRWAVESHPLELQYVFSSGAREAVKVRFLASASSGSKLSGEYRKTCCHRRGEIQIEKEIK
ncbi:hypothetical protein EVAR_54855_1 [Eumeta japonica]|uniref:Uncharacterized protein n=1 Tax=Eumeta variegata TaxID=151549 RepID=A0A4C1YEP9_EUMVA|nr:hypothetical protein EVAR_54855_1 [Eumeta japonica]